MTPRQSIDIATAALRWQTARELRLAAGAEKRLVDAAYKTRQINDPLANLSIGQRSLNADAALVETRRQERAAVRTLTKACANARREMQAVNVLDITIG
jgi:hypothetical protein